MEHKIPGEKQKVGQDRAIEAEKPTESGAQSDEIAKGKDTAPVPASPTSVHSGPQPRFGHRPGGFGQGGENEEIIRVRLPRSQRGEVLGVIQDNFGSKLLIKCIDGKTRICRIPGKIRYKLHVKIGDTVLVQKWVVQSDERGDYLYKYSPTQANHLIKRGFMREEDRSV